MKTKVTFLVLCLILISEINIGQIIYQTYDTTLSVNDDTGPSNATLYLDINNDSIDDYYIILNEFYFNSTPANSTGFLCQITPLGNNTLDYIDEFCNINALYSGDTIWNNLSWQSAGLFSYIMYHGEWDNCTSFSSFKYCPLKLSVGDETFFGWLKIKSYYEIEMWVPGSYGYVTISDFAFNSQPDCGLIAGDTISSLSATSINKYNNIAKINIFPNPADKIVNVSNIYNFSQMEIRAIDGNILYKSELSDNEPIDVKDYDAGIYFVVFSNNKNVVTKKLIITH